MSFQVFLHLKHPWPVGTLQAGFFLDIIPCLVLVLICLTETRPDNIYYIPTIVAISSKLRHRLHFHQILQKVDQNPWYYKFAQCNKLNNYKVTSEVT